MDNAESIGLVVSAIISLGGFTAIIMKFIQPINDLKVVIQRLNDNIEALQKNYDRQNDRLDKHEGQINDLDNRVGKIETKIELHH